MCTLSNALMRAWSATSAGTLGVTFCALHRRSHCKHHILLAHSRQLLGGERQGLTVEGSRRRGGSVELGVSLDTRYDRGLELWGSVETGLVGALGNTGASRLETTTTGTH